MSFSFLLNSPVRIPAFAPAHFFFVKKDKWRMADHDMIVEQDRQPILVLNRTFGNIVLIIVVMGKGAIPRTYSARSVSTL